MDRLAFSGSPFPFGLTFVPPEVLGPIAGPSHGYEADLARACRELVADFAFVDASREDARVIAATLANADVAPVWALSGPLWPVLEERGVLTGLRETLTEPQRIGELLESRLHSLSVTVDRGVSAGARVVVLAEDLAGTRGPLVAPDFAIGELLPRYAVITEACRLAGVPAVFHSDGDIRPLLPAIARAGFVAVHAGGGLGFEQFLQLFDAAREAGLAVMGGLLTGELTDDARGTALGASIGVLAGAGPLLLADDGGITTPGQFRALARALEAARAVARG